MKLYNSMSGRKEDFVPLDGNNVKMYACGITVYDLSHIGHARQAIAYAMVADYLRYRGYNVTYVRNYTDVDDKIINRANELGKNPLVFSEEQIAETETDMANLHVTDADVKPKATENIENIIEFVQGLIDKGHAYAVETGDVYFDVRSFPQYGRLSNRNINEMMSGFRKDVEPGKRDPIDFALWKSAKPGEISWDSPWGLGRPGWHIECSTMVLKNLGETIDIHGGGKDLVFPHHENEIAQSEALTGKLFAKYWSHCGLIKINGEKMSKSLGNALTIREALQKHNYEVIKYVMFLKHYTSDMDLTDREFALAEAQMYYFYSTVKVVEEFLRASESKKTDKFREDDISDKVISDFIEVMDDDFNTAAAFSNLHSIFKYINNVLKSAKKGNREETANTLSRMLDSIKEVYGILGMLEQDTTTFLSEMREKYLKNLAIDEIFIEGKIAERLEAKKAKDFAKADAIRSDLDEKGIILMDSINGTTWDVKALFTVEN